MFLQDLLGSCLYRADINVGAMARKCLQVKYFLAQGELILTLKVRLLSSGDVLNKNLMSVLSQTLINYCFSFILNLYFKSMWSSICLSVRARQSYCLVSSMEMGFESGYLGRCRLTNAVLLSPDWLIFQRWDSGGGVYVWVSIY